MQKSNRRDFIQKLGLFTGAALVIPEIACSTKSASKMTQGGSLDKFGIQLYTLRDEMPKDPKGVMSQVAKLGYKQLEGYEGAQGIFWGMKPKELKTFLSDNDTRMISTHCNIKENFKEKVDQAAEAGLDYLICPYIGPQKSMEDWKMVTDLFNQCGKACKEGGIKFAYHNHEYSFKAFAGMIPHDFIMTNTDPEYVDHEMDIYWVVTGGADPIDFLTRYPNRFRLCHVKDRIVGATEREASCDLGTGSIDFKKILTVAREKGMQYYILEQERYDNSTPMKSAAFDAEYLRNFRFA